MARYLIKPVRHRNFYVEWSSGVDQAISWGSREDFIEWGYDEKRLERCDNRGTSAYWFYIGAWNQNDGKIWSNQGWLPYTRMEEFLTELEKRYPGDEEIPDDVFEDNPDLEKFLLPLDS